MTPVLAARIQLIFALENLHHSTRGNRTGGLPLQNSGRADPPSRTMFHAAKDALAGRSAKTWANKRLARYGKVQALKIDSRRQTVEVSCLLDGEATPITIKIENYLVETEQGKKFLRATAFRCTRPWLQNVLTDFGHRQRIELPAWAAAMLSPS